MSAVEAIIFELRRVNAQLFVEGEFLCVESEKGVISGKLRELIVAHKDDLISYLIGISKNRVSTITKIPDRLGYVISSAQRRLWILSQMEEGNVAYNMPGVYEFTGELDVTSLGGSFKELISRHEILRTVFREDESGEVRQYIQESSALGFSIGYVDMRGVGDVEVSLRGVISEEYSRAFDLSTGPLLRANLYQTGDERWVFTYTMHHIISDGWSMGIVIRELLDFYRLLSRGEMVQMQPLRIQYRDYASWQQEQLSGLLLEGHKSYWLDQLSGELPVLELRGDYARPVVKSYRGGVVEQKFSKELTAGLRQLSQEHGCTLFMGLLTLVKVLLYRYTGQEDIIIGSPIAGREHADLEGQIGFYVNMLALRTRFSGKDSFLEVLKKVKKTTLDGYEHQVYPFDELVESVYVGGNKSRHAFFDIVVVLQNNETGSRQEEPDELKVKGYNVASRVISLFDLRFDFKESAEGLNVIIEYNSDIYNRARIERMCGNMEKLLSVSLLNPGVIVERLNYLCVEDLRLLTNDGSFVKYPQGCTLVDLFEEQVACTPGNVAVVLDGESVTYGELNERSNRIAHFLLRESDLRKGEGVGLLVDRSVGSIASMLGVLKAGGMYVPMEPDTPEDRLRFMINDIGMRVIITEKEHIELLNRLQWLEKGLESYLCIDSNSIYAEKERKENLMMNQELWDHVGEGAVDQITGGGWSSSFTGEAMGDQEMEEYALNAHRKLSGSLHKGMRVLEIGCSSGLTLSKIAPEVEFYYGTDLSPVILENTARLVLSKGWDNVRLKCLSADALSQLEEGSFDLIIMNSVIQHFHGHNYLRKVILEAVALLKDDGEIFIGDIMDMDKKDELVGELERFKALNKGKGYKTKIDVSAELFVSKGFFEDMSVDEAWISDIEIGGKIYTIENELTKYRYDVILKVDKRRVVCRGVRKNKNQFDNRVLDNQSCVNPSLRIGSGDLAYVIYTSGTTGRPKGVMIEHVNVVRLFRTDHRLFDFGSSDVWTMFHSYCFDFSVWEMYGALLHGGKLILVPKLVSRDTALYLSLLEEQGVTVLNQTPSAFYQLMKTVFDKGSRSLSIRYIIFGGEALDTGRLAEWHLHYPLIRLINMYGITETTVHVTYKEITEKEILSRISNIGKPIPTLSVYVLDGNQQLLPFGVGGELYVGGAGVSRGYINQDELTRTKFINSPFKKGERLYRTGDNVMLLENGDMEYLGRLDDQVKIRGYRIELGEVEHALQGCVGVESCVVVVRSNGESEKELVGYVVGSEELNSSDLRSYLRQQLPDYMIPSHYVQLEVFPLTANGKIDKKRLPDPLGHGLQSGTEYEGARNETEARLIKIWEQVLGREKIGIRDDFFELGGHSLKATRLASQLHKEFEVKIALRDLFSHTMLYDQALLIDGSLRTAFTKINRVPEAESYVISSAQRRLWILSQMEEGNVAYNMPGVYEFTGELDVTSLGGSFKELISRHEILRTVFREDESGEVRQYIQESSALGFSIGYVDMRGVGDVEVSLRGVISEEYSRAFDLSTGPLLRANLYQTGDERWVFTYTMHHIISDGWSMGIVIRELLDFYRLLSRGEMVQMQPLRIQYRDYASWQQEQLSGLLLEGHKSYWLDQLSGELPVLELRGDYARPVVKSYRGGMLSGVMGGSEVQLLRLICRQEGATLFMGIVGIVNTLLYRYTGQEDIIIGSPIAGREHADLEGQIGFYLNMLALRTKFSGKDSFLEVLKKVKKTTLDGYEHQVYPFDELIDALHLRRDMSRSPLFDVIVVLQNNDRGMELGDEGAERLSVNTYGRVENVVSKYDLSFSFTEVGSELHYNIEYNSDIYNRERIERMCDHLLSLCSSVTACPESSIESLEYMSKEERWTILEGFNDTLVDYEKDKTLVELFEEQVERTPEKVALVYEGKELTYEELNIRSNQLGHYLRERYEIGPDDLIGIMLERSEELVVSMLGVLKSGGAYVPIDPDYPEERKSYLLQDSGCRVLLDESELGVFYQNSEGYGRQNLMRINKPGDLAYVIYTSGTTGRPKGVMIEHRSVVNMSLGEIERFNIVKTDRVLQFASFSFDASVFEIFMALYSGASLIVVDKYIINNPNEFIEYIKIKSVSVVTLPPTYLNVLDLDKLCFLRIIIIAGEPPHVEKAIICSSFTSCYNAYGPTECTVCASVYKVGNNDISKQVIPIGRPIWNTEMYIVGQLMQLLPVGVTGEICIGGEGLARGYLNLPELTAEKFVSNPFREGERMYRTGDLGRWLPNGNIEFLGRLDDQVKIRGYRIELGEVEHALQGCVGVESCVVVVRSNGESEKELVGYVVGSEELNSSDLRSYLRQQLPDYMIPSHYVQLEVFPLTANGKIDKKRLPDPLGHGLQSGTEYEGARNETEARLIKIWEQVLGREKIGIRDDFFELGGHSLKATKVINRIKKEILISVSIKDMFINTTIAGLAKYIETCLWILNQSKIETNYTNVERLFF